MASLDHTYAKPPESSDSDYQYKDENVLSSSDERELFGGGAMSPLTLDDEPWFRDILESDLFQRASRPANTFAELLTKIELLDQVTARFNYETRVHSTNVVNSASKVCPQAQGLKSPVIMPAQVTGPSQVTPMSAVITRAKVTGPSPVTPKSRVITPAHMTGPSQVTPKSPVTTPAHMTGPSQVTPKSRLITPGQVTGPSQVTPKSRLITPAQATGPNKVIRPFGPMPPGREFPGSRINSTNRLFPTSGIHPTSRLFPTSRINQTIRFFQNSGIKLANGLTPTSLAYSANRVSPTNRVNKVYGAHEYEDDPLYGDESSDIDGFQEFVEQPNIIRKKFYMHEFRKPARNFEELLARIGPKYKKTAPKRARVCSPGLPVEQYNSKIENIFPFNPHPFINNRLHTPGPNRQVLKPTPLLTENPTFAKLDGPRLNVTHIRAERVAKDAKGRTVVEFEFTGEGMNGKYDWLNPIVLHALWNVPPEVLGEYSERLAEEDKIKKALEKEQKQLRKAVPEPGNNEEEIRESPVVVEDSSVKEKPIPVAISNECNKKKIDKGPVVVEEDEEYKNAIKKSPLAVEDVKVVQIMVECRLNDVKVYIVQDHKDRMVVVSKQWCQQTYPGYSIKYSAESYEAFNLLNKINYNRRDPGSWVEPAPRPVSPKPRCKGGPLFTKDKSYLSALKNSRTYGTPSSTLTRSKRGCSTSSSSSDSPGDALPGLDNEGSPRTSSSASDNEASSKSSSSSSDNDDSSQSSSSTSDNDNSPRSSSPAPNCNESQKGPSPALIIHDSTLSSSPTLKSNESQLVLSPTFNIDDSPESNSLAQIIHEMPEGHSSALTIDDSTETIASAQIIHEIPEAHSTALTIDDSTETNASAQIIHEIPEAQLSALTIHDSESPSSAQLIHERAETSSPPQLIQHPPEAHLQAQIIDDLPRPPSPGSDSNDSSGSSSTYPNSSESSGNNSSSSWDGTNSPHSSPSYPSSLSGESSQEWSPSPSSSSDADDYALAITNE